MAKKEPKQSVAKAKRVKVQLKKVVVMLAPFSQNYKKLTAEQFREKKIAKLGNVALGEKVLEPGKPYEVEMTREVQAFIKDRVLQVIKNTIYGRPK